MSSSEFSVFYSVRKLCFSESNTEAQHNDKCCNGIVPKSWIFENSTQEQLFMNLEWSTCFQDPFIIPMHVFSAMIAGQKCRPGYYAPDGSNCVGKFPWSQCLLELRRIIVESDRNSPAKEEN